MNQVLYGGNFARERETKKERKTEKGKPKNGRKKGGPVWEGVCGCVWGSVHTCVYVSGQAEKTRNKESENENTAIKETHTVTRENAASRKEAGEDGKSEEKVGITCLCFSSRSEERRP